MGVYPITVCKYFSSLSEGFKYVKSKIENIIEYNKSVNSVLNTPVKGVDVRAEVFKMSNGKDADYRRQKKSLGIDVLVEYNKKPVLAFDLKFGRSMSNSRVKKLKSRFQRAGLVEVTVKGID